MIRVFLKIFQLVLHIKEPVAIEINIKKQEKTITLPENFALIDGRADINASFQFHMTQKNPTFQICIVLCLNKKKKLAGWIDINLKTIQRQQTIHIEDHLRNCPDLKSTIKFELMYLPSPLTFLSLELISEDQVQQMSTLLQLSQIQEQKRTLQTQNRFLENQYKQLIQQNKLLYSQIEKIQDEETQRESSWKKELQEQEDRQNECLDKLEKEKHKMAQILDIVFQSGDSRLIQMIQEKIQIQQQSLMEAQYNINEYNDDNLKFVGDY